MGLFGKRGKFVDLSEGYSRRPSPKRIERAQPSRDDDNSSLGFLGNIAESSASTSDNISWDNEPTPQENNFPDKKQKLARRLLDMTNKMEDLSNQIYHLNQRIELLEKKLKINFQ